MLVDAGFAEESLLEQMYDFQGDDNNLDMVAALLAMGFCPNVCFHKEKRRVKAQRAYLPVLLVLLCICFNIDLILQVLTMECKAALIHKSSVNCSSFEQNFPSPFFVFGEKVRAIHTFL